MSRRRRSAPLAIETPAPIAEMIDLYARGGLIRRLELKTAIMQWWKSDSYGFRDGASGELVAVFGLCPVPADGETVLELWFACAPAIRPHLLAIAHIARLTLARAAQTAGLRIVAQVLTGRSAGARLARLAGLQRATGPGAGAPGLELWQWASGAEP